MSEFKNWKEYINRNLIDSGKFLNPKTNFKGETEIETYKSIDTKSLTEIRVGYLKNNSLIYLQIFNPKIPGYNKYTEDEYFYQNQFKDIADYGNPALEFNEENRNGILSILKSELKGKEIQFIQNGKILKSNLYISETQPSIKYSYYFTKRSLWKRLFEKKIENISGIEKREIELKTIFKGINTNANNQYNQ